MISIWQPRWHDRKVLIAKYKVQFGDNEIEFTKAKNLKDKVYRLSGKDISQYPVETNGTIECFAVPLEVVLDKELSNAVC